MTASIDTIREALLAAADGREEYAETGGPDEQFLRGQAAGMRQAAGLLSGRNPLDFLASEQPSWRWSKDVHDYVMRHVPGYASEAPAAKPLTMIETGIRFNAELHRLGAALLRAARLHGAADRETRRAAEADGRARTHRRSIGEERRYG